MRKAFWSSLPAPRDAQNSWFHRVAEKFSHLIHVTKTSTASANGAPIHLLRLERSGVIRRAQSASFLAHALLLATLAYLAFHPATRTGRPEGPTTAIPSHFALPPDLLPILAGNRPATGNGNGSGHGFLPATTGQPPPRSSVQLVKPMIPQIQSRGAPIPPTLFDPSTPRVLASEENIGVPWTKERTDSAGRGRGITLGNGDNNGDSVGDNDGNSAGNGTVDGIYRPGMIWAKCSYCPDPEYTEEARKQKLQGSVFLEVLVGADGRTGRIRVVRGLGLGLDDRATESVRGWKFVPAHDASGKALPTWITVEAIFRLF